MPTFAESIDIPADREHVFALAQDYDRRLEWDPCLKHAELLDGASEPSAGVHALCVARSGVRLELEHVTHDPPGTTAVSMSDGPWFLSHFAATWIFTSGAPGTTHVVFRYRVRTSPSWLRPVMEPLVIWKIKRDLRRRLDGLRAAFADPEAPTPTDDAPEPRLSGDGRRRRRRRA